MKFILLVEGQTERDSAAAFLKRWLDPRLTQPVGIQVVPFDGYAELVHKMAARARMYLEGPRKGEIIAVIGLLDLYGPTFYPAEKTTAAERHAWAKQHLENEVGHEKFRLFFAVHEFEAWLLSQPAIFPSEIGKALPKKKVAHPERINFNEPPAKLLDKIYQQKKNAATRKQHTESSCLQSSIPSWHSIRVPTWRGCLKKCVPWRSPPWLVNVELRLHDQHTLLNFEVFHSETAPGFLSTNPRWCQYGYAGVTALAASSFAICSGVRFQPIAPRFWRSCSSFRAPMITVETVGRCSSQLSAICGTVLPVSFATSSRASTTR